MPTSTVRLFVLLVVMAIGTRALQGNGTRNCTTCTISASRLDNPFHRVQEEATIERCRDDLER